MKKTIVLTGAAGCLGGRIYPLLQERYDVVLTDVAPPAWLAAGDRFEAADVRNLEALRPLVRGASGIVHFAAIGGEDTWENLRSVSIDGTYNVYEAARLEGVRRIVYASSVHAVGYYPRSQSIGVDEPTRPDSRYGVSKCCGEAIASLYSSKYGLSSLAIRIGNASYDEPTDERLLSIWISKRDLVQLVVIGLEHSKLEFEIVYGASGNVRSFWDNRNAYRLGYRPQDNAEDYAAALLESGPVEARDGKAPFYQGGKFVEMP